MSIFSILHLSDSHIGNPRWSIDSEAVLLPLLADLKEVGAANPPSLIVFSGDLVYGDLPDKKIEKQFDEALLWLLAVHGVWNKVIGEIPIIIVPGNHDIQRSVVDEMQTGWLDAQTAAGSIEDNMKKDSLLWKRMLERQDVWWNFIKTLGTANYFDDTLHLTSQKFTVGEKLIGVVGYNSSWSSSRNKEKGRLWFTKYQFHSGLHSIQDCDFLIAVLHHPFSWFHPDEEQWMASKFEATFDLILHGHIHSSWYSSGQGHVILSAGPCYAGSDKENGYYWVDVDTVNKSFDVGARTYQDKGKGSWIPLYIPGKYSLQGKVNLPFGSDSAMPSESKDPSEKPTLTQLEIAGSVDVAMSMPTMPPGCIERSEEIASLLENFDTSSHLLLLIGNESIGKTVLSAQLAVQLTQVCLSVFITRTPNWSNQLSDLRYDLCNQVSWLTTGKELKYEAVTDSELSTFLHKLRRHAVNRRSPIYVIIDGLNNFTARDSVPVIPDVLNLFGLFTNLFYFSITLNPEDLPADFKQISYRTYRVPRFDRAQTMRFLGGDGTDAQKEDVWLLTNGHPAALSSIKRLLHKDPNLSVQKLSARLPELLEREWRQVDIENSNQVLLLAALALFPGQFDLVRLSRVLNIPAPEVQFAAKTLPFIVMNGRGEVAFTSEALRLFVATKTKGMEVAIRDAVITDLMSRPEELDALQQMPLYLHEAGRHSDLLNYLSPDHLELLLQQSQSWHQTIDKTDLAFKTAFENEELREYARFALHKASLLECQNASLGDGEIRALLSLNRWEEAIAFAEVQITKENQLRLFSHIAKTAKEKAYLLPATVAEAIQKLVSDSIITASSEQKLDIASELVYSYPDLAIRLVESLSDKQETIDSALADVSIRAFLQKASKDAVIEDTVDDINAKIGDERARRFTQASQMVFGNTSVNAVLSRVKALANPRDQIFLLRQWSVSHPKAQEALPIIEYALELIVRTTDFQVTAAVLRELASPLPYVTKSYNVSVIVTRISDQIVLLKDKGFTRDYVKLQLTLAQTEAMYAESNFRGRFDALYFYVADIEDLSLRCSCFALMCSKAFQCQREMFGDEYATYRSLENELRTNFQDLLRTTADHYTACAETVRSVAYFDFGLSMTLIGSVNTEPRRNQLYLEVALIAAKKDGSSVTEFQTAFDAITYRELQDIAAARIIQNWKRLGSKIESEWLNPLFDRVAKIGDPLLHCKTLNAWIGVAHSKAHENVSRNWDDIFRDLHSAWEQIDDLHQKKECGFDFTAELADFDPSIAVRYFDAARNLFGSRSSTLNSYSDIVYYSIHLSIRFFRGLIPRGLATNADRQLLIGSIANLTSLCQRAQLYGELATSYLLCDRKSSEASTIVLEQINPTLDSIAQNSHSLYEQTFSEVAPVLYVTHPPSARQRLLMLEPHRRDLATNRIAAFILEKTYPDDPFSGTEKQDYKLRFQEVMELLDLVELVESDGWIYWYVKAIVDSCQFGKAKMSLSPAQLAEIVTRLRAIVAGKLPNPRFIKHAGYKIIAEAQIGRLGQQTDEKTDALIAEARQIENIADRAFVLALIASTIPNGRNRLAKEILVESFCLVEEITTLEDRIEHYQSFAEWAKDIDRPIAQKALRQATMFVPSVENWRSRAHARRIIDAAHRLDKHLAEELASKFEKGSDRFSASKVHEERSREEKLKGRIVEEKGSLENLDVKDLEVLPKVARQALGDMNAGKIYSIKLAKSRQLIQAAAGLSFHVSYNIWLFIAESLVEQYKNTNQSETFLRQLFEAALINSELTQRISSSGKDASNHSLEKRLGEFYSGVTNIPSGSRQRALEEIEQWCSEWVREYVIIVDPSFRIQDLPLVELIRRVKPSCSIIVLASKSSQHLNEGTASIEESFKEQWRKVTSSLDPGSVEFIFVGATLTGELPLENRMLLTLEAGLMVSAGFSQLGVGAEAQLRRMSIQEARERESEMDPYIDVRKSSITKQPFSISRFTLY